MIGICGALAAWPSAVAARSGTVVPASRSSTAGAAGRRRPAGARRRPRQSASVVLRRPQPARHAHVIPTITTIMHHHDHEHAITITTTATSATITPMTHDHASRPPPLPCPPGTTTDLQHGHAARSRARSRPRPRLGPVALRRPAAADRALLPEPAQPGFSSLYGKAVDAADVGTGRARQAGGQPRLHATCTFMELEQAATPAEARRSTRARRVRSRASSCRANDQSDTFTLVRYKMNCCAADAIRAEHGHRLRRGAAHVEPLQSHGSRSPARSASASCRWREEYITVLTVPEARDIELRCPPDLNPVPLLTVGDECDGRRVPRICRSRCSTPWPSPPAPPASSAQGRADALRQPCLPRLPVVRHVFGIDDPDAARRPPCCTTPSRTPPPTSTISTSSSASEVADWVPCSRRTSGCPTRSGRRRTRRGLSAACWQVRLCKLADLYDNLNDSGHLRPEQRPRTLKRSRRYLYALEPALDGAAARSRHGRHSSAYRIVTQLHAELEAQHSSQAPEGERGTHLARHHRPGGTPDSFRPPAP